MADTLGTNRVPATVHEFRLAGGELLERGAALVAYDMLAEGLARFPGDVRLRQLLSLALARTGASQAANQILEQLAHEGHADEETLGLLARTHKDLWADGGDPREQRDHLQLAFRHYLDAHRLSGGYWSGINAATMALMLGDDPTATALARTVRDQCLQIKKTADRTADRYWVLSTLGEAALILREWREAEDWYSEASVVGRQRFGDLASTRRNARLILRHLGADSACIDTWLWIPPVVVFVGHLIDDADRKAPRFPPSLESTVRTAICEQLQDIRAGFGYASAACGADILFLESLLEVNGEPHIVLPYNREQFVKDSVDIIAGADWPARYERVLDRAAEVITASAQPIVGGRLSYEYGFMLLDGMAAIRADELDTELVCLAVWDQRPGDGPGGTATAVEHWRAAGRNIRIIDLNEIHRSRHPVSILEPEIASRASEDAPSATVRAAAPFEPQIVGILFADARGFSKLTEQEIPIFVEHFLGTVADELAGSHGPIFSNTWGDGLYFVFNRVRDAGEFALRLCEVVRRTDWIAKGLAHDLSLRIGLHAGPAYACVDPITRRANYVGAHVSRAARIEPITPPGQVYASGAFAALARSEQIEDFRCTYVGQMSQAKEYGVLPTYVVHRRRTKASSG